MIKKDEESSCLIDQYYVKLRYLIISFFFMYLSVFSSKNNFNLETGSFGLGLGGGKYMRLKNQDSSMGGR